MRIITHPAPTGQDMKDLLELATTTIKVKRNNGVLQPEHYQRGDTQIGNLQTELLNLIAGWAFEKATGLQRDQKIRLGGRPYQFLAGTLSIDVRATNKPHNKLIAPLQSRNNPDVLVLALCLRNGMEVREAQNSTEIVFSGWKRYRDFLATASPFRAGEFNGLALGQYSLEPMDELIELVEAERRTDGGDSTSHQANG